jgi:osmoprotectant transport system permease protein
VDQGPAGGERPVNFFSRVWQWLTDPQNWHRYLTEPGIPTRIGEHLEYTGLAVLLAAVVAVPIGVYIGHTGRGSFLVVGIANSFRAVPEIGLLQLLALLMGIALVIPAVTIALVLLAIPPMLAGTYSGMRNVDRDVVDAARGVGMSERDIVLRVELPMALPLIIATATIAAFVSLGGLGHYIIDGRAFGGVEGYTEMAGGAVLVAALAIAVELVLAGVQRLVVSPGLRTAKVRRRARRAEVSPTADVVGATS